MSSSQRSLVKFKKWQITPKPVHAELVEALHFSFSVGAWLHEEQEQSFDKLRIDGAV